MRKVLINGSVVSLVLLMVIIYNVGTIATIINVLNPSSRTEIKIQDNTPVIILHNSLFANGHGVHGRTFGHVVALNCDESNCSYFEKHEMAHVKQANVLGMMYIPAHLYCQLFSYIVSGDADKYNPLEIGPYHNNPQPW